MELVHRTEVPLFRIALTISVIFWLLLVLGTLGLALVYVLFFWIFAVFAHSAFISYLKGNGVRVTPEQFPDLHKRINTCAEKLGMESVPEAYVLRTDFFNALATRFLGRNFLVLFSDVLDCLEDRPGAVDFFIGHELGHIQRKHLVWMPVLWPALILPLLGAAYRRAEEYTCDRYGTACCESEDDIKAAMGAMAAGDTRWRTMNTEAYRQQIDETSGFFMSFNELTADYPWLTKRVATALAMKQGREIEHPGRSKLAWLLACIVPRFGVGGLGGLVVLVAMIGVLAAVAIPAYQDYQIRAQVTNALALASTAKIAVGEHVLSQQQWPASLAEAQVDAERLNELAPGFSYGLYENGIIGIEMPENFGGGYVVLEPMYDDGDISWICYGQDVEEKYLPPSCR